MMAIAAIGLIWLALHHFEVGRRKMTPAIGMILSLVSFVGFLVWYIWDPVPASASTPFAALDLQAPTITLQHRQTIDEWAAEMYFDISNSTDQFLDYEAALSGQANNVSPDTKILNISGLIKPKGTIRLIYRRIAPIVVKNSESISVPAITAQLVYSIKYGIHDSGKLDRLTGKTINFEVLSYVPNQPIGSKTEMKTNVIFTDAVEK